MVKMSSWLVAWVWLTCVVVHTQSSIAESPRTSTNKFSFASYYGDHMVLQKSPKRTVIWGYGVNVDDAVSVYVSGRGSVNTTVTMGPIPGQPVWIVQLPAIDVGGPYKITATSNKDTVSMSDVLFGDVWVCSGQSNMQFTMDMAFNATRELNDTTNYNTIRVFAVNQIKSRTPQYDIMDIVERWSLPSKSTIGHSPWKYFSAVCWLYGKYLSEHIKYPIGLIDTSYGGTRVEAWSSPDALDKCGLKPANRMHDISVDLDPNNATVLWNAMIHPLLNMTISGAIWYQGESNAYPPKGFPSTMQLYNCTFPRMIDDWRQKFHAASEGQTDELFPFGFVQLAPWRNDSSLTSGFSDIRWHQTSDIGTVPNDKMKNVFMAVAMDLPDFDSPYSGIHPRDKQNVAKRLLLSGLAVAYNQSQIAYQGPFPTLFIACISESMLKILFDNGATTLDVRSTDGFEICYFDPESGSDCHSPKATWYPTAIAFHDNTSVIITYGSPCSKLPGAVRYAWRESPCPLFNCAIYNSVSGLPGPPFIKYLLNAKHNVKWQASCKPEGFN